MSQPLCGVLAGSFSPSRFRDNDSEDLNGDLSNAMNRI
jgi:hypothetical protein